MKKALLFPLFILLIFLFATGSSYAQNPVNWTSEQLMDPAVLANSINTKTDIPIIVSVGPGATIPNSINVGMVNSEEGLEKLKSELKSIAKDKNIVVYCGCCPFEHCPNVRPAIETLKEMKFTHYYLLNLPHNIKADWIDKGYPTNH